MNDIKYRRFFNMAAFVCMVLILQSCVKHQQLLLFEESDQQNYQTVTTAAIKLESDDVVILYIAPDRPENSDIVAPFNITEEPFEYVVDEEGYLSLPFDRIYVKGLTLVETREAIKRSLQRYLTNPAVILKFKTFKITVLGEVKGPGTYSINDERISILEAIGLAGGMTVYADRSNIQVVREREQEVTFDYVNLKEREFSASEYFYLKQNDILHIQPLKQRTASVADPNTRILPYLGLITGLVNLVIIATKL